MLLSGTPIRVFGQILSGLSAQALADVIRQDFDEYSADSYVSNEDVLSDAYLMSGQGSEDIN